MKSRALLIALVVVLGLAAGAFYMGRHTAGGLSIENTFPLHVASQDGFSGLFGVGPDDDRLVGVALMQLERAYYKPIDPQTPFRGVSQALLAYLKSKHIRATLPTEHATGDFTTDATNLEDEVAYAQSHYGLSLIHI